MMTVDIETIADSGCRLVRHVVDLTSGRTDAAAVIADAVFHGGAARQVASRSTRAVLSCVGSNKMASAFDAESGGEERTLVLADVLEDVLAFRPQPVEVRWNDGLQMRRSFPDVGVVLLDGSVELWECKPRDHDEDLLEKLKPLTRVLRGAGVEYRVRTPRWFKAEPRLSNARRLARQGDRQVDPGLRATVGSLLNAGARTFGQLRQASGADVAELLGGAARGVFAINIDGMTLGDASAVRVARKAARSGAFLGVKR